MKLFQCLILHVTKSETEIKLFQPLEEFRNCCKIISATLNMLENIHEVQRSSEIILKWFYFTCNDGISWRKCCHFSVDLSPQAEQTIVKCAHIWFCGLAVQLMLLCADKLLTDCSQSFSRQAALSSKTQQVRAADCWCWWVSHRFHCEDPQLWIAIQNDGTSQALVDTTTVLTTNTDLSWGHISSGAVLQGGLGATTPVGKFGRPR